MTTDENLEVIDQIHPEDIDLRFLQSFDDPAFGFVLKTFTKALHKSYPYKHIPDNIFCPEQTKVLKSVIYNGAKLLVASVKESESDLLGYALVDDRLPNYLIIHWVHIKSIWRRMGVAKQLLNYFNYQDKKIIVTNITDNYKFFKDKLDFSYNPYLWR
jgi:hypothetical protein